MNQPTAHRERPQFDGLRVLLVEDESVVSFLIEDMLRDLGCAQVWHVSGVPEGLKLLEDRRPDAAVLDVNLGGGTTVFPLAQRLVAAGIPFIFATGYGRSGLPAGWSGCTVIQKPFQIETLAAGLARILLPGEQS